MLFTVAVLALAVCAAAKPTLSELPNYSFEAFLQEYGKSYSDNTEYQLRKTLFENRVASFVKHNNAGHSYTLNVNKFADLSNAEIRRFKGYNHQAARSLRATGNFSAPVEHPQDIPASKDWRTSKCVTAVKDQGGCGSCWAFGSAETLESHTCLHGKTGALPILSPQQLVDCAPNPNHCGGTGGCEGSIPELAYDWVKKHGLASEADYPYNGNDGQCKTTAKPAASVTGYVNVPSNNYTAVMEALQQGPLAITVAAEPWEFYDGGVFTECPHDDIDLDHVVQLVGYGTTITKKDYWIVRNSWGGEWGENGYIRIERHSDSAFCGTDNKPADGTGCSGGPSSVKVCGACGILYDAVYPTV
jgi:cathepsin L